MSVDISWDTITAGPDGAALAEKIRDFIHFKFQQITLPRFIKSVHVHSFEFGSTCPDIEIKDVCDPLPDFYEDDEESDTENDNPANTTSRANQHPSAEQTIRDQLPPLDHLSRGNQTSKMNKPQHPSLANSSLPSSDPRFRLEIPHPKPMSGDMFAGPFPRSGTPGIPGGTSNLGYFHLPMGGLSGTQTPLAAVASGTPFSPGPWQHDFPPSLMSPQPRAFTLSKLHDSTEYDRSSYNDPGTRPSTANSIPSPEPGSPYNAMSPELNPTSRVEKVADNPMIEGLASPATSSNQIVQPSDLQVVARVKYSGDVRMTLTAEILLDYPMPSFVGIPVRLAITGMTFDGVAIIASIRKKMHFCFLDPQDAEALVGEQISDIVPQGKDLQDRRKATLSGILQEIHVESEIGKQENGKQVLKNVGKVEKFIIEQIRKIFEEEFIFPSFWTFLV